MLNLTLFIVLMQKLAVLAVRIAHMRLVTSHPLCEPVTHPAQSRTLAGRRRSNLIPC